MDNANGTLDSKGEEIYFSKPHVFNRMRVKRKSVLYEALRELKEGEKDNG